MSTVLKYLGVTKKCWSGEESKRKRTRKVTSEKRLIDIRKVNIAKNKSEITKHPSRGFYAIL